MDLTKEYLDRLIADQIEESGVLEYKSARSLAKNNTAKTEITKDVSAFANARGGTVIYGIIEYQEAGKRHLPERYDPVDQSEFSREWLDQIVGLIQSRIDGLEIVPLHIGPGVADYCYAVTVPAADTAHQALDLKYYKRRNFESTAMEDYEVRDVMNRRKNPIVTAEVRIVRRDYPAKPILAVRLRNTSSVLAAHYRVVVEVPVFIGGYIRFEKGTPLEVRGNLFYWEIAFRNGLGGPLFPDCSLIHKIEFEPCPGIEDMNGRLADSIEEIHLTVYADEMVPMRLARNPAAAEKDWT